MIRAIAQTKDGYLWLGSETGLYRFDGVRFERYKPTSGPNFPESLVTSLLAVPDGGLWIGFGDGYMSLLKDGVVTNYGGKEGLANISVSAIIRDHQGTIWAICYEDSLYKLEGARWQKISTGEGFSGLPLSMFVDRKGTLWVGTRDQVLFLPARQDRFQLAASGLSIITALAEAPDATMWMAALARGVTTLPVRADPGTARPGLDVPSQAILFDTQGSLWVATQGQGLYRITDPQKLHKISSPEKLHIMTVDTSDGVAESFKQSQGLSNDAVRTIIQDREGNIWVGTRSGLDRFHQSTFATIPFPSGTVASSLTVQPDGSIQAASLNKPLLLIKDGSVSEIPGDLLAVDGLPFPKGFGALASYIEKPTEYLKSIANKSVLLGTADRPRVIFSGKLVARPQIYYPGTNGFLDAKVHAAELPTTVIKDKSGRWWFSLARQGVFRSEKHGWTSLRSLGGPADDAKTSFSDAFGHIWFGFRHSTVAVVDGDSVRVFSRKDGLNLDQVIAIHGHGSDIWVADFEKVEHFDGTRFRPMQTTSAQGFANIKSLLVTSGEGIWLTTDDGIIQIPESEVRLFRGDDRHHVALRIFDKEDGVSSVVQGLTNGGGHNAAVGNDGRLYFATTEGVVWVDPKRISRNNLLPPLSIESLTAGGITHTFQKAVMLIPGTTSLQIHYAAMSLSTPERVRFRYKLEGADKDWQDANTRRDAYYTNLSHGNYVFRVIACNEDGLWNETGAAASFTIAPTYYQTKWFQLFCAVIMLGLLWLLYLWRLRLATAQIQERLGAQLEERERIARELHDTLLQGFQGLMLRFQAIMKTLPKDQPAHRMMEQVLERADGVLLEGRQSVRDLREKGSTGTELAEALSSCGEELAIGHSSLFSLTVVGSPQPIEPVVFDECYRIAREALINAFQHSSATKIEAEVSYSDLGVSIGIRDDGKGIDAEIVTRGRAGHWGLSGMRERAHKIGAKINIWSSPGAGTEIELIIPRKVAYVGATSQTLGQRVKGALRRSEKTRP